VHDAHAFTCMRVYMYMCLRDTILDDCDQRCVRKCLSFCRRTIIKHVALKPTDKISDVLIQLIFCISQWTRLNYPYF